MMKKQLFTLALLFFVLSSLPETAIANVKGYAVRLTSINPADSSTLVGFTKGDIITFTTNADSLFDGFNVVILDNSTNNIVYEDFTVSKNNEGKWELPIYEDVVFLKGRSYQVEMTGHEGASAKSAALAKIKAIYYGNSTNEGEDDVDDYEYSSINYLYFSPNNGADFKDLRFDFIIIEFSGDVSIDTDKSKVIDEDGNEHDFQNIIPLYDRGSAWRFFIPTDILLRSTSHFKVHIYAKDLQGRAVKGNNGKGENSYYELIYKCEFGYPFLSVSPQEGIFISLKDFIFSNDQYIEILNGENEIQLLSSKGEVMEFFKASDLNKGIDNLSFTYSLEKEMTTEDYCTLKVPEGTFSISSKILPNKETLVGYEICSNAKLKLYGVESINPADGYEVESLSNIFITFEDTAMPYYLNPQKITVTDDQGELITYAKATYDENRKDYNQCIIVLDTPITTPGHYHLNIPPNTFFLGNWGENASKEMTFDFTVVGIPELALTF